jgi:DNA-binding LacI/PurR family transcriptional regulator
LGHATIKDIARKLQISTSTVSRALRDKYDVKPETREKVLELAKELNYLPSSQALGLKQKKTLTIGVVVPEIDNEFFSDAIYGIENVAFERDYHVMICQTRDSAEREERIVEKLLTARVDGIILSISSSVTDVKHLKRVMEYDVPLVLFDRISDKIDTHKVLNDDYDGALKATEHLIQRGKKRIAHLAGSQNLQIAKLRRQGYEDALKQSGLKVNENFIVESGFKREDSRRAAKALLIDQQPDAIFCASDNVAIGALLAARELGLKVPEEVAIMGFSNLSISELIDPPLSTINQPAKEMGETSAKLLLDIIGQEKKGFEPKTIVLKTEVVAREST